MYFDAENVFDLKAFIIALLRRGTHRHPAKNQALTDARLSRGIYACASCKGEFKRKEIDIDHVEPVVPLEGFPMLPDGRIDWTTFIHRMFPDSPKGYQILCKPCHKAKSKAENSERAKHRKAKKA